MGGSGRNQSPQSTRLAFKHVKQVILERGRGRRTKCPALELAGQVPAGQLTRGWPRRHPVGAAAETPKRGRGRPRKYPVASLAETPKRGPGRPPKDPPAVDGISVGGKQRQTAKPVLAKKLSFATRLIRKRPAAATGYNSMKEPASSYVTVPDERDPFRKGVLLKTPEKKRGTSEPVTPVKESLAESDAEFQPEGFGVIMLEDCADEGEAISREALMAKDHLLLPTDVVSRATELCSQMVQLAFIWHGSEIDLHGELWEVFLKPAADSAAAFARAGQFARAFAELLGVVLFTARQDAWLRQQEVHLDWADFRGFFEGMSAAWTSVLAQSDAALGLAPPSGKLGGYRPRLHALLQVWQDHVNRVLEEEGFDKPHKETLSVKLMQP